MHQKQYEICIKYYKYCVIHAYRASASSTAYSTSCVNVIQIYQTSYIAYQISHVKYQITYVSSIKHQTLCMCIPFICIHTFIILSTCYIYRVYDMVHGLRICKADTGSHHREFSFAETPKGAHVMMCHVCGMYDSSSIDFLMIFR